LHRGPERVKCGRGTPYTTPMRDDETDEILGITRCVRCGHRLDGDIECPVCTGYYDTPGSSQEGRRKWVFLTACFLTSPLSLYAIVTTDRLSVGEKVLAFCGCLVWFGLWWLVG